MQAGAEKGLRLNWWQGNQYGKRLEEKLSEGKQCCLGHSR